MAVQPQLLVTQNAVLRDGGSSWRPPRIHSRAQPVELEYRCGRGRVDDLEHTGAAGQDRVATGTFFGHPWLVSGINTWNVPEGSLCVAFSYRGSVLQGRGVCETNSPEIPAPPPWARSVILLSLRTASDG
jgi:hypothetical protein